MLFRLTVVSIFQIVLLFTVETVEIPAFTKDKKQFSYVERVIGCFEQSTKFKIQIQIQNVLPIDLVMTKDEDNTSIDKILKICCALTNLNDSVIPFE